MGATYIDASIGLVEKIIVVIAVEIRLRRCKAGNLRRQKEQKERDRIKTPAQCD